MKDFDKAAAFTMVHEGMGTVSEDPKDPGGLTKYGISQRAYPHIDIRRLTGPEAGDIYRQDYWDKIHGDDLPAPLNIALFDFAFNSGIAQAIRELQRVLGVTVDGVLGPVTLAATKATQKPKFIARDLNVRRIFFLASLATWPTFGLGWTRRVLSLQEMILEEEG